MSQGIYGGITIEKKQIHQATYWSFSTIFLANFPNNTQDDRQYVLYMSGAESSYL